jgi:O-antigen ligase
MHPLRTSYYLSLAIILSLLYVATSAGYRRWLASLLSFFIFCALITTLSKGPLLSLFAGLFVLTLAIPLLRRRFILVWIGIAALLVLGFLAGRLPTGNITRSLDYTLNTATDQHDETSSLGSRIIRWRQGLQALYDTWGMGTGVGGFYRYTKPFFLFDSVYVHMIVEYGFAGACLYLWLLVAAAKRFVVAHARCREPALRTWMLFYLAGFVTLVFNGLTSENQLFLSFWFYLGLGHALSRIAEEGSPPPAGFPGSLRLNARPA